MLAAQGHQLCRLGLGSGHDTQSTKRRKDSTTPSPTAFLPQVLVALDLFAPLLLLAELGHNLLALIVLISAIRQQREELCQDRKSTRLNSSHSQISYAVFCLKKKRIYNTKRLVRSSY